MEYVKMLKREITNLNDTEKNKYINSERLRGDYSGGVGDKK